jgi:hypothetical protein
MLKHINEGLLEVNGDSFAVANLDTRRAFYHLEEKRFYVSEGFWFCVCVHGGVFGAVGGIVTVAVAFALSFLATKDKKPSGDKPAA